MALHVFVFFVMGWVNPLYRVTRALTTGGGLAQVMGQIKPFPKKLTLQSRTGSGVG